MLNKLKNARYLFYLLLSLHSLSSVSVVAQSSSKGGRKNVQMIEEIQRTVNQILNNQEKNSAKHTIDWQQKLVGFENNIYVLTSRIEKIIDWIDTNKLNNKVFDDRLDRLESKISTIESIISDKLNGLINKSEQIISSISNSDTSTDGKLRKLMNIITDAYQLSKETSILLKGRHSGSSLYGEGGGDAPDGHNKIDDMQKKLLEQLSVVEVAITNQVSNIAKMSKESLQSLHDIIIEMLNLRDECHTQRVQQNKCDCNDQTNGNEYNDYSTTTRSDRHISLSSDSPQCPTINMSHIQHDIGSLRYQIGDKIETEITKISKKIDELSKNRTVTEIKVIPNESTINTINEYKKTNPLFPLNQFKFAKKIINPIDRPTGRSSCHTSDLIAPKSCKDLKDSGADCDGVYIIMLSNTKVVRVYCDMTDNGGGWTVILRRGDFGSNKHKISFNQDWNGYKGGFGDVEKGEFWLGLENIHRLTSQSEQILQVDLESFDDDYISLVFDGFRVADEAENYKLNVGNPLNSNASVAESLISHNVSMFTTRDRNNGINEDNCATKLGGGWWFHNCHSALLTAPYFRQNDRRHLWQGMQWHSWKQWHHLKAAQMKIRSKS